MSEIPVGFRARDVSGAAYVKRIGNKQKIGMVPAKLAPLSKKNCHEFSTTGRTGVKNYDN